MCWALVVDLYQNLWLNADIYLTFGNKIKIRGWTKQNPY